MNGEPKPLDLDAIEAAARAATPQDFDSAEDKSTGGWVECPACGGEGSVEVIADYLNYDNEALGVQFYGVGNAHVNAEAFYRAVNPAVVLALVNLARHAKLLAENLRIAQQLAKATVTAVTINPGDVLVIRTDSTLNQTTYDQFAELSRNLSAHFPVGTPVLLTNDVDISALDEDAMRKAGWVKAGSQDAELRKQVLGWWDEHQFDSYQDSDGDGRNFYDDEPDFVRTARDTVPSSQPALDPRTPKQMMADGWKPVKP